MAQEEKLPMESAGKIRAGGKVLPKEDVEIFSTGKGKNDHLGPKGTKHIVHAVLAQKLIDKGHAYSDAAKSPKKEKGEAKLSAAEIKALETRLGHKPTDEDLAEALKLKEEGGDA